MKELFDTALAELGALTSRIDRDPIASASATIVRARRSATLVLPMGSVHEGALFVLCDAMVLRLREMTGVSSEEMRARHAKLD